MKWTSIGINEQALIDKHGRIVASIRRSSFDSTWSYGMERFISEEAAKKFVEKKNTTYVQNLLG